MGWRACAACSLTGGAAIAAMVTLVALSSGGGSAFAQSGAGQFGKVVYNDGRVEEVRVLSAAEIRSGLQPFRGIGSLSAADRAESLRGPVSAAELEQLSPQNVAPGIEAVIGSDTRVPIRATNQYPVRATALVTSSFGTCTGFFYGPDVVATAGECLYKFYGNWASNVRVWPGYYAGIAPYGSYAAKWISAPIGWVSHNHHLYNYGVVKLNTNVGNAVGWFGLVPPPSSPSLEVANALSYDLDGRPYFASGVVQAVHPKQVFYRTDTYTDRSRGAPVWVDRPAGSPGCANGPCVFTMHTWPPHYFGPGDPHSLFNHGPNMTEPSMYSDFWNWYNKK